MTVLSHSEMLTALCLLAAGTALTRYLPFIIFRGGKKMPKYLSDLSGVLPPAMMGLLLAYCLKSPTASSLRIALPEVLALSLIAILHWRFRKMIVSIGLGTLCYMLLLSIMN